MVYISITSRSHLYERDLTWVSLAAPEGGPGGSSLDTHTCTSSPRLSMLSTLRPEAQGPGAWIASAWKLCYFPGNCLRPGSRWHCFLSLQRERLFCTSFNHFLAGIAYLQQDSLSGVSLGLARQLHVPRPAHLTFPPQRGHSLKGDCCSSSTLGLPLDVSFPRDPLAGANGDGMPVCVWRLQQFFIGRQCALSVRILITSFQGLSWMRP